MSPGPASSGANGAPRVTLDPPPRPGPGGLRLGASSPKIVDLKSFAAAGRRGADPAARYRSGWSWLLLQRRLDGGVLAPLALTLYAVEKYLGQPQRRSRRGEVGLKDLATVGTHRPVISS